MLGVSDDWDFQRPTVIKYVKSNRVIYEKWNNIESFWDSLGVANAITYTECFYSQYIFKFCLRHLYCPGPLLLTWFNFHLSMD